MTWRSSGDGSPTLAGVENRPAHRLGACAQPLRGSSVSHPLTLPLCLSNFNENQNRSHFFAGKHGVGLEGAAPKAWEVGKAQPPGVRVRAPNRRFERQRGGAAPCGGGLARPPKGVTLRRLVLCASRFAMPHRDKNQEENLIFPVSELSNLITRLIKFEYSCSFLSISRVSF